MELQDAGFNLLTVNLEELIRTGYVPIQITSTGIRTPERAVGPFDDLEPGVHLRSASSGRTYPGGARGPRRGKRRS